MENLPIIPMGTKVLLVLVTQPLLPVSSEEKLPTLRELGVTETNLLSEGTRMSPTCGFPVFSTCGMAYSCSNEDGVLVEGDRAANGSEETYAPFRSSRWLMGVEEVIAALFHWKSQSEEGREVIIMAGGDPNGSDTTIEDRKGKGGIIRQICVGCLQAQDPYKHPESVQEPTSVGKR